MKRGVWLAILLTGIFGMPFLRGSDEEASAAYRQGYELYQAKEYYKALKKFRESELLAAGTTIRANSVRAQIGACRMCGLLYQEFQAIETLLARYPEYAAPDESVRRQYELGDLYFRGKREPAFYALRSIPWLCDRDKSMEIYSAALKRSPYAEQAPAAHLRLAYLYDQQGDIDKSIAELKTILEKFPEKPHARTALLALAHTYAELALRGDGDGFYARESRRLYDRFLKTYPDAPEKTEIMRKLQLIRNNQAARLEEVAEFYNREGRKEAAERYMLRTIREFPETAAAVKAEQRMTALDRTFVPGDFPAPGPSVVPKYRNRELPAEEERMLLFPGQNDNHFLLPVPDLSEYLNTTESKK